MSFPNKRTSIFKSPLARRLTIQIILVSTAITLFLTVAQLYWMYQSELTGVETELRQVKQVHTNAISQSLWATNHKEVTLQLEGITQIPNIIYAAVHEGKKLWAEAGRENAHNTIKRQYPLIKQHRGVTQRIGTLTVVASKDKIQDYVITQAIIILASNAFKTFLVAGFMLFFFHNHINRYLSRITDHMHQLDIQTITKPLSLKRIDTHQPDEFDTLVDAVNKMHYKTNKAHTDLTDSKDQFHAIADYTIDWESWVSPDGQLIWVNPSVTRMTGYTPDECYEMSDYPLSILSDMEHQKYLRLELSGATRGSTVENIEVQLQHKDGRKIWAAMSWQPIYDSENQFRGYRSSVRDISYLKEIEENLNKQVQLLERAEHTQKDLLQITRQEKARLTSLLSAMKLGILFEDVENRVMYTNPAFRRIWLIPDTIDLGNRKTTDVLEFSGNVLARPDHFSRHILQIIGTHETSETFELSMADGRVVTQLSYPVNDQDGRYIGRLWVYEDITRERQTAEQLIYLAERDSLTGLYNRHRFQEEMMRILVEVDRNDAHGALLFFDLDEFKYINDTYGHRAGDTVLIRIAGEVSSLIRRNEIFSRIGGDEFAILTPRANEDETAKLAERIIRAIGQIPFRFEGQNLRLTTSLGIALYPLHGKNAEELIAHADTAMYQAKEAGKNAWRVYRQDLAASKEMLNRLSWNERISNALEKGLLKLHFQGVFNTGDGQFSHVEALIRMLDETDPSKIIMPGYFIQVAEKTGKILDIDRWVIAESIRLLAKTPDLNAIAVNISGRSFDDPNLPGYIRDHLIDAEVDPARFMVELTETAAVSDLHDAQRFIESLHQTGCQVCLDDFGSGFSSFAYLKNLRADILKIDGIFIRDLPNDRDNQIFVKSIVDVARGMHKKTVAEFVEDAETLEMLRVLGVDLVQGYYLDMPQANHPAINNDNE